MFANSSRAGTEFEAVIDTGFGGFISMPMSRSFPLGLPLRGAITVKLADGTTNDKLHALGCASVAGRTRWGTVILQPDSQELLVGLKFLQAFDLALIMTGKEILLPFAW